MPILVVGERFVIEDTPPREGATARVYKARDHKTGEVVALKLFEVAGLEGDLIREIFLRETEALSSLRHSNVVKLISAGQDNDLDKFYIALEWVEHGLISYWDSLPGDEQGWDTFASVILEPILSGLALAHSRQILHRDIKPSNILVTTDGIPKLADFGIAKLLHSLRLGLTVSDFASHPFAPPEHGKAEASARGDLFSLGITVLRSLTPRNFQITHSNLDDAVHEADLPIQAEEFVRKLIALNPSERPVNAQVALNELERLRHERPVDLARPRYHLTLLPKPAEELRRLLGLSGRPDVERAVLTDLADPIAIYQYPKPGGLDDTYILLGQEFSYHVGPSREYAESALVIINALQLPPSLIERRREQALPLAAEFVFSRPVDVVRAREVLTVLREQVAEFTQEQKIREKLNEERRLFRGWEAILRAKTDLEKTRERPLAYIWFEQQGRNLVFTLEQIPEDDLIEQARCGLSGDEVVVCGVVDDVVGNRLVLFVRRGSAEKLPQKGFLVVDTMASQTAIRRQRRALDEAQYDRALRSDLGGLLVSPEHAKIPQPLTEVVPIQRDLDRAKIDALTAALGAPDMFVVQGPPGTGKTTWIAELVCQFLARNPGKKVLLSAQTHIAVDNALSRIRALRPELRVVRVGPAEKISPEVEPLQVSEQVRRWSQEVKQRSAEFLRGWAKERGVSDARLSLASDLESLESLNRKEGDLLQALHDLEQQIEVSSKQTADIKMYAEEVFKAADEIEVVIDKKASFSQATELIKAARDYIATGLKLLDRLSAIEATGDDDLEAGRSVQDLKAQLEQTRSEIKRLREGIVGVVGDRSLVRVGIRKLREAVEATLTAFSEDVSATAKLQSLHREWALRLGYGSDFEKALVSIADIVGGTCLGIAAAGPASDIDFDLVVIDEASKATPTEALVAMTRGRSWVLVGDQKQLPPFVDVALVEEGLVEKYDLSKRDLEETLFDRLIALLPNECKSSLTVQHRMVPAIGDLISDCFYDGMLDSSRSEFEAPDLSLVLPRPVTWFSTSRLVRRRETKQTRADGSPSYQNLEEATRVREWLERLEGLAQKAISEMSVGVITGYSAQKDHLRREIAPSDRLKWQALKIEVNSVDAFQGRERDVLVYSATRSNEQGVIGFLSSEARLNVALSRGRYALVIFGDADHCRLSGDFDNPFRRVLEYAEEHPQSCSISVLS